MTLVEALPATAPGTVAAPKQSRSPAQLPISAPVLDTPAEAALPLPTVGVVVLSLGDRPKALAANLASVCRQRDVALDVVVVGNGWEPVDLPPGVRPLPLPENVGVPAGRNLGARYVRGDVIVFVDDDAELPEPDVLRRMLDVLAWHPRTAAVQPRPVDPGGAPTPRRCVPRLRVRPADPGGVVAGLWEGVCAVRRSAFEQAGGWPGQFFYGHEGIELVWRLWDAGWVVRYVPQIVVHHPATNPTRHAVFYRMNARNRVWVARRNLPGALAVLYVAVWTALTIARVRHPRALAVWFAGLVEGMTTSAGPRRPLRWRTAIKLARAGRPPIV